MKLELKLWCNGFECFVYVVCLYFCVASSPQFRFSDHIERGSLDDDQPKKMLLKRDADSYEV